MATEIKADLSFAVQNFVGEVGSSQKDKKKFTLEKTENFLITASGKIVSTDEKEEKEEIQIDRKPKS
jgi:hypothetical protein